MIVCFCTDSDGYEFVIVSLDNRQWYFDAQTAEVESCFVFISFSSSFKQRCCYLQLRRKGIVARK